MPLYSDMGQNSRARFVIFQSEADQGVHLPYDLDITFLDMERFLVTPGGSLGARSPAIGARSTAASSVVSLRPAQSVLPHISPWARGGGVAVT